MKSKSNFSKTSNWLRKENTQRNAPHVSAFSLFLSGRCCDFTQKYLQIDRKKYGKVETREILRRRDREIEGENARQKQRK